MARKVSSCLELSLFLECFRKDYWASPVQGDELWTLSVCVCGHRCAMLACHGNTQSCLPLQCGSGGHGLKAAGPAPPRPLDKYSTVLWWKHQLTPYKTYSFIQKKTPANHFLSLSFCPAYLCWRLVVSSRRQPPSAVHHILFFFLNKCIKSSHFSHCQLTQEKQENCHPFSQFFVSSLASLPNYVCVCVLHFKPD